MSQKKEYYEGDFIAKQVSFYAGLPEKQRRHFPAIVRRINSFRHEFILTD